MPGCRGRVDELRAVAEETFRSPEHWHGRRSRSPPLSGSYGWGVSRCWVIAPSISVASSRRPSFRLFRPTRATGESASGHQSYTCGCACCEKRGGTIGYAIQERIVAIREAQRAIEPGFLEEAEARRMCDRRGSLWLNTILRRLLRFWHLRRAGFSRWPLRRSPAARSAIRPSNRARRLVAT